MKVLVSEYVCGGGWPEASVPVSLLREGRAMLEAIVHDLSRVPGSRVVTTLDARQEPLNVANIDVVRVHNSAEEADVFARLAAEADACLIIAPELGDVLTQRCQAAIRAGAGRVLNPDPDIVSLCSDKFRLFEFLLRHEIPTIPTELGSHASSRAVAWSPVVVKPRFGAGSQGVQVFESAAAARLAIRPLDAEHCNPVDGWIVQPLVRGVAVSVGVIADLHSATTIVLPVAIQNLSTDGRFQYLGGQIPWNGPRAGEVHDVVTRTCGLLPGLDGYVGFDLVVPDDDSQPPVVVEINPRLTTSYLGYRQLANENLAERIVAGTSVPQPVRWKSGSVAFLPNGSFEFEPTAE